MLATSRFFLRDGEKRPLDIDEAISDPAKVPSVDSSHLGFEEGGKRERVGVEKTEVDSLVMARP
jgi:hypothetical protein